MRIRLLSFVVLLWAGMLEPFAEIQPPLTDRADSPPPADPADDFSAFHLDAHCAEALEGGPVVVELTLTYLGRRPITVVGPDHFNGAQLSVAASGGWIERIPEGPGIFNAMIGPTTVAPGEQFRAEAFLHQDYQVIPVGKSTVTISWAIHVMERDAEGQFEYRLVASPEVSLEIDVPSATPERIEAFRKHWEVMRDKPDFDLADQTRITGALCHSQHPEFLPFALRLLRERSPHSSFNYPLLFPVYEWSRASRNHHTSLIDYLCQHGGKPELLIFDYWQQDKVELSERDVKSLLQADSIWIQARIFAYCPSKCSKGTRELIGAKIRELSVANAKSNQTPAEREWRESELEQLRKLIAGDT